MLLSLLSTSTYLLEFWKIVAAEMSHLDTDGDRISRVPRRRHATHN
jgi:hypothetical protein